MTISCQYQLEKSGGGNLKGRILGFWICVRLCYILLIIYIVGICMMTKLFVTVVILLTTALSANDSNIKLEIDAFWQVLDKTVMEGDAAGYRALHHDDAVIVFKETGESFSIDDMMIRWSPGFQATAEGKVKAYVESRYQQRIISEGTAWETGIFHYWEISAEGEESHSYIWFDNLMVKKNGKWLITMELQDRDATIEEWNALEISK